MLVKVLFASVRSRRTRYTKPAGHTVHQPHMVDGKKSIAEHIFYASARCRGVRGEQAWGSRSFDQAVRNVMPQVEFVQGASVGPRTRFRWKSAPTER